MHMSLSLKLLYRQYFLLINSRNSSIYINVTIIVRINIICVVYTTKLGIHSSSHVVFLLWK